MLAGSSPQRARELPPLNTKKPRVKGALGTARGGAAHTLNLIAGSALQGRVSLPERVGSAPIWGCCCLFKNLVQRGSHVLQLRAHGKERDRPQAAQLHFAAAAEQAGAAGARGECTSAGEGAWQRVKMPMFCINTNVSKDAVPESLTGELTQQLAKATGKPAQVSAARPRVPACSGRVPTAVHPGWAQRIAPARGLKPWLCPASAPSDQKNPYNPLLTLKLFIPRQERSSRPCSCRGRWRAGASSPRGSIRARLGPAHGGWQGPALPLQPDKCRCTRVMLQNEALGCGEKPSSRCTSGCST